MDKQKEKILTQISEKTHIIRERVYEALTGKPFSMEALADALAGDCTEMDKETLVHTLHRIQQGIKNGEAQFEELYQMDSTRLTAVVPQELEAILSAMDEAEQRRYLLLLFQLLCHDSGYSVDGNMALYLANMPLENLKKEATVLLEKSCRTVSGEGALLFDQLRSKHDESASHTEREGYSREEQDLIEAAVMYAAMQKTTLKMIRAESVGQMYGVQKHWYQRAWTAMKENAIPVLLRIVTVAAVIAALVLLIHLVTPTGFLLDLMAWYVDAGIGWFVAIMLMTGVSCVYEWLDVHLFSTSPIFQRVYRDTETSRNDLAAHMKEIQRNAHAFVGDVPDEEQEEDEEIILVTESEHEEEEGYMEENQGLMVENIE